MADLKLRGPGRATRAHRTAISAFPRGGQHGGYDPAAYDLLWVVTDGDVVAAYATAHPDGELLHLRGCYVRPDYRGRGLQSRLLMARVSLARRRGFRTVRTYAAVGNVPSLVNLLRAGFVPQRVEDGFLTLERST